MYGVYLCGATDCFLHAMFVDKAKAEEWAEANSKNPEGYLIKYLYKWHTHGGEIMEDCDALL